ncbi:hypothetical protein, partial [Acinetobacter cumulans]|uniref:hypothetical protein n=1 Tax=Acinetobacter cumulans TaxID=2136182 RepID=UPI001BC871D3
SRGRKPKKPTWKQVGFFMCSFDIFRQQNRSLFSQIETLVCIINSSTAQIIPNFCGQPLG